MSPADAHADVELIAWLRALLSERLGIDRAAIDMDVRLHRYGLTSLTAAGIVAAIEERTGRKLAPTLVWDYPTLGRLAGFLEGRPDAEAHAPIVPLAADDPIAIVGMACRLPGADSLDRFWSLLQAETDAIREVPADRWPIDRLYDPDPLAPGRMATRWGGFLDAVDRFDADFFGMSPREAAQADPQQRLALELAWESLEDAGIRPSRLLGSRTGVFLGAMWSDYARLLTEREDIAQHTATGQDISIISARIAYTLGLEGPALTIDTACSSALVAVHQACQSLRTGESTVALAGGVHLLLAPESSIAMTKFGAMAPDGRCKAFDARANGYVRGEGGGIVVLKPLSAARAAGDRIHALIRGSAMNNDGPSNGLTAPNPAAQRAMLRDVLAAAQVHPHEVDYVEAHGTGTALGDPIEANALASVLCRDRPAGKPLLIGSVKSNIGHLEAAAGAAGLIKLALALRHRWVPASLHYHTPNPAIDFASAGLAVQSKGGAWPSSAEAPIGGVSSFGFGGTNCHVLLQALPSAPLATSDVTVARPVFVFAGNGGNWPGMAQALMNEPIFAAALQDCDGILAQLGYPAPVLSVLAGAQVTDVALGQPALCAFQLALVDLFASLGVTPAAVVGHSVGEAAAAVVAGALTREDALRLVVERSRLQAGVAGQGCMALVGAPAEALHRLLPAGVTVAGENGPRATLIAGARAAVDAACSMLDGAGIVSQPIDVPVAYHSAQMEPLRPLLEQRLASLRPKAGSVPLVSTVTGAFVEGTTLDARYWGRNLREPVRFRQAIATLLQAGHRSFVELAPHPLLAAQIRQMAANATVVGPVRRDAATPAAVKKALAPLQRTSAPDATPHLLVLSARSPVALEALAKRWAERLPGDWAELCHTARVGRERFAHRLALRASDGETARRLLGEGKFLRGEVPVTAVPTFDARRHDNESPEDYLDRCAAAFVAGADIDAASIEPHRIVSAPTYAFERERHWLAGADAGLSYELTWQPLALPAPSAATWPTVALQSDPVDAGLEVEAVRYARAALSTVPSAEVIPRHRALVERLATWKPLSGPPAAASPARDLLRRVGEALPALLTGRVEALEVLFPSGELASARAVYESAPFAAAQRGLAAVIGQLGSRPLRLLELGSGTGALTAQLLPLLPVGSTLVCSDVSMAFLATLRERFPDSAALRTAEFDLDHPTGQQGPFDAIVAANVVHAAASLGSVLAELRRRLAPGGVLGLVELVRAPRWIDLVFGIADGWWRFRGDPLRPDHALLDAAAWRQALSAAGFVDIEIRPDGDDHAVILARTPATQRVWRAGDAPADALVEEFASLVTEPTPLTIVHGDSLAHAAVSGAARSLSLDHPDRIARSIELGDEKPETLAALDGVLGLASDEDQFRLREGAVAVARVTRAIPSTAEPALPLDALYVIAGGGGRLGRAFSRFLIDRGVRHLLLVGRSQAANESYRGVTPRALALDLTSPDAADKLRAAIDRPLGGMIHAAGLVEGSTSSILASKLEIAATLERAAAGRAPGFVLLFSSAAGVWGTRGHVAYAAANRALDHWAEKARERGLPATSIAFGRFAERGLLSREEAEALDVSGLRAMQPDDAFAAALRAVGDGVAHRIVASVDWPRFRATFEARRRRPLLDLVAPEPTHLVVAAAPRPRLSASVTLDRAGLAALVADLLGHADPSRLHPDRGLFEQGLDSLLAVALRRRLEEAAGIPIPAATLFAHPTLTMLADWLAGHARVVPVASSTSLGANEPIAIVGMSCRFAGGADTPATYLARLMEGRDALGLVPPSRPTASLWQTAPLAVRTAGFLDAVEKFDAAFFGISPREAVQLDPQQRLLLEVAWHALEDAGIAPDTLSGKRAGVFIGATGSDYANLARARGGGALDAHSLTGQPSNALAGRLAYQFGIHGPALTVDTACSSSLVALHLAVKALRSGEADLALAGGVNLLLTPDTSLMLMSAGLLAADGRCKVFDASANGYVRGEGCGVVVLKPLGQAVRDGDRVLATIRGTALNHDGRSSSFTAPNGAAQVAVIRAALADAGVAADAIDWIEAHGTGTALGDPIELDALGEVFAGRSRPLPVGSVKAAIGHTEAAAGIAAVIKAVLCLRAGRLPPQPHFAQRNPHARPDGMIEIATGRLLPASARYAGVSAFGASGTNAHAVIDRGEEPVGEEVTPLLTAFNRQAFWLPGVELAAASPEQHPVLGEPRRSARSGEIVWELRLDPKAGWLRDHVVEGAILMPAAGFLDMARRAGVPGLADVEFRAPLPVPPEGVDVQLVQDRAGTLTLYAGQGEAWTEIATARIDADVPAFELEPARGGRTVTGSVAMQELADRGFEFGPTYRGIDSLARAAGTAEAGLESPLGVDPPAIDAAIQTLTSLLPIGQVPLLPARIARVAFHDGTAATLTARAQLLAQADSSATGHAVLEGEDGTVLVALHGIELRAAPAEPGAWFHDLLWRPVVDGGEELPGRWHAIGPGAATLGVASHDETGLAPLPIADGIVDLRPMTETDPAACVASTTSLVREATAQMPRPRIILVSRGASTAPPTVATTPSAASVLMGLQPVIAAEHPELSCRWIDLDPDDPAVPRHLAGEAGRFAIRQGRWLSPEIVKATSVPPGAIRLAAGPDRSLSDLRLLSMTSAAPRAGHVRIAVSAAGLNFKDVLAVLGRSDDHGLGLECAGTVAAVGADVRGLSVGDAVIAFGAGSLATEVTLPATQVLRRPDGLDADCAASLPVASLTAWHGLHDLAGVKAGDRVLVHAGAGGVGGMAIQIARLAGARVFATTSRGKERAALAAGAEAVGDSRSLSFVEAAGRWAGPDGFDVVLNALGPEFAVASAALLRPGGTFLEIGSAPRPAGVDRHVTYALEGPMRADPGWFADRMGTILALVRDGRLFPPRRTVLPLAQAEEALQALAQGRTIGKLVLRLPHAPQVRGDGTYIVTGGTGGVGRALAGWLADAGAGRVVVVARHLPTAKIDARFQTVALDIADRGAVAALLSSLPNVRGVIHAAGVVSDATLAQLQPQSIATVFAPKVTGARILDTLTRDLDLDFFVLVSSTAGSLAAPGQAAYASANAWLDALAAARRAAGRPASSIAFGPWSTGMFAALDATQRARLERDGFRPMAPRRATAAFARALGDGAVHRLVMDRIAAAQAGVSEGSCLADLLAVPPAERLAFLQAALEQRVAALLGFPAGTKIGPTRALRDVGLDSLLSVSLRNELAAGYALELQATVLFDHPTLATLAAHLLQMIAPPEPAAEQGSLDELDEAALAALVERELEAIP